MQHMERRCENGTMKDWMEMEMVKADNGGDE